MLLKDMSKEDVELLSYTDLTNLILTENKSSMNTPTIFKKICDLLGYSEEEYMDKIGDFYTSLTIDKRFVLLENHEWDLRERHAIELVLDEESAETESSGDSKIVEELVATGVIAAWLEDKSAERSSAYKNMFYKARQPRVEHPLQDMPWRAATARPACRPFSSSLAHSSSRWQRRRWLSYISTIRKGMYL